MSQPHIRPEGDERWIYVAHRHWMALFLRSLIPVVLGLTVGGVFLWRVLGRERDFLGRVPPVIDGLNIALVLTGLLMAAALLYIYVDWRNDHLIVSNKRLIHEDRTLWLSFNYQTIPLNRIQNVNVRVDNFLQYTLEYGRIEVQAAGPTAPIVFDRARCPNQVQAQIMREVQREKREQERIRLQAAVQRRLDPRAPAAPVPFVPIEYELRTANNRFQALLPLAPILQGDTVIWHRHWLVLLGDLLWPAIGLLLWLLALVALPRYGLVGASGAALLFVVGGIIVGAAFFWQYDNWINDIYMLEPTRLVELSRLPFGLFEDRREAPLAVIQNVNATQPNLVARVFGYGNVLVETAGAAGNFTFDHVPDPDQVQRIVFEYVERFRWNASEREWNNAITIMEMYEQARRSGTNPP